MCFTLYVFNFRRNCQIVFHVVFLFYTPSSHCGRVQPTLEMMRLFDFRHPNSYVVVPYCGFYLNFPNDQRCWTSFPVLICHLCIFFGKVFFFPYNFLKWIFVFFLLSFASSLCIINASPSADRWSADIFSQSVVLPFHVSQRAEVFDLDEVQFILFFPFFGLSFVHV